MTWSTPTTWSTNQLVDASALNTHIRDNENYLLAPTAFRVLNTTVYSTTGTTPALVNAALSQSLTTHGGHVLLGLQMYRINSAPGAMNTTFYFSIDGTLHTAYQDTVNVQVPGTIHLVHFVTGLSNASHTFAVQWKVDAAGTAYMVGSTIPNFYWAYEG